MEEVTLLLPEAEARKWILFQQYYNPFSILVEKGVFSIKNGQVVIHFDPNGNIGLIERSDILYSSRFK